MSLCPQIGRVEQNYGFTSPALACSRFSASTWEWSKAQRLYPIGSPCLFNHSNLSLHQSEHTSRDTTILCLPSLHVDLELLKSLLKPYGSLSWHHISLWFYLLIKNIWVSGNLTTYIKGRLGGSCNKENEDSQQVSNILSSFPIVHHSLNEHWLSHTRVSWTGTTAARPLGSRLPNF